MARLSEPTRKVVRSDGSVRYQARVDIGRLAGGRRGQQKRTFVTRREAREWLASIVKNRADGTLVQPTSLTVSQALDEWLQGKRDLRPSTRRCYVDALKPVHLNLGQRPIQSLSKSDLDRLVVLLLETGGPRGQGRSPRTVTLMLNVLQQALDDAFRQGLLVRNVAALVQRPRARRTEIATWTADEVRRFAQLAAGERIYVAWLLTLMGLRRGEVLGLRWREVSLEPPVPQLRIRQTRVIVAGKNAVVSDPKTSRGRRTLPLDPQVVAAFDEYRERRESEEGLLGRSVDPSDHVVVDELGKPYAPDRYSDMFQRLAVRAGVRKIRLHDARHTALTLMALRGVPLSVVAAWAGKADHGCTLGN
jgi:integrase